MKPKVSITERLAGSIHLDDQKLIDEIIESEIWDYDEDLECMADWPSDSEKADHEATTPVNEKHMDPSGELLSPIDSVRQWRDKIQGRDKSRRSAGDDRVCGPGSSPEEGI